MAWGGLIILLLAGCLAVPRTNRRRNGYHRASLSPESQISLTIKQVIITVAAIVVGATGYAYLVYNETSQGADIATIKTTINTTTKDQDQKRDQLGKDFLTKQDELNTRVSQLNTSVQLLQHDTAATAETLKTISNQLGNLTVRTMPVEGKPGH